MDTERIERIIENKYSLLLFFLLSLMVVSIVSAHNFVVYSITASTLSFIVYIIMLRILKAHRFFFIAYLTLAFSALLLHFLSVFVLDSLPLGIVALSAYIVMIGFVIIFMIKRIFSERLVTGDTIKGGISVYLLMATWWQLVYYLIYILNPDAFKFASGGEQHQVDFLYYSVTTMTSVGFGDILPVSYHARVFSMLQALIGQLYIGILVARLVGLHVAGHSNRK